MRRCMTQRRIRILHFGSEFSDSLRSRISSIRLVPFRVEGDARSHTFAELWGCRAGVRVMVRSGFRIRFRVEGIDRFDRFA